MALPPAHSTPLHTTPLRSRAKPRSPGPSCTAVRPWRLSEAEAPPACSAGVLMLNCWARQAPCVAAIKACRLSRAACLAACLKCRGSQQPMRPPHRSGSPALPRWPISPISPPLTSPHRPHRHRRVQRRATDPLHADRHESVRHARQVCQAAAVLRLQQRGHLPRQAGGGAAR